jgi:hypothetical protein
MAELLLKVGVGTNFADGDVLCAFNRRRIRCCHAQHHCHFRKAPRNDSGLIVVSALARDWFEATHQYRFERVSAEQVKRVVIATSEEELFGPLPNARGEHIDVRRFLARRKLNPLHRIFGEDGMEYWYGGRIDMSHTKLDLVWNAIETKTLLREAAYRRWPMGERDLRSHLAIAVDDFDDVAAAALESPEIDDDGRTVLRKRLHRIDWEARLSLDSTTRDAIRDRNQTVDIREATTFTRSVVVEQKTRVR